MSPEQYKVWATGIASLTNEQASDALTRFKLLSKGSIRPSTGKQEFGDRVVIALCDMMKSKGVECSHAATLKKSAAYTNSKPKFDDLAAFFETISKSKLVQDSVLKTAISLLYVDLLQWQGVAISSHTVLKQIHRIPSVLNRHFPGYAASGLLHKIVKGQ